MSKKLNKSTKDFFNNVKVSDEDVAKYVKKLRVVSKKKMIAGITAATVLVAGGIGAGTYFGIKAANAGGGGGGTSESVLKDGEIYLDPTSQSEASISKFTDDGSGNKVGTVTSGSKIIESVKVSIGINQLTKDTDFKILDEVNKSGSTVKVCILKSALTKYKGAVLITPVFKDTKPVGDVYSVTFNSNGGSVVETQVITSGEKVDTSKVKPTRDGYDLDGWFKDNETFAEQFDFDTPITSNITLYAKWSPKTEQDTFKFELTSDGKGYAVTGYNVDKQKLVAIAIPSEYNGLPVTEIGENAFQDCYFLTEVSLPDTIQIISDGAFTDCYSLNKINLPESLLKIGISSNGYVFARTQLSSVILPKNLEYLCNGAFDKCKNLKKVVFNDKLSEINEYTFEECTILSDVTLGKNIRKIKSGAFSECSFLKSLNIPFSLVSFDSDVFSGDAPQIESLTFEDEDCGWQYCEDDTWSDCEKTEVVEKLKEKLAIRKKPIEGSEAAEGYCFNVFGKDEGGNYLCSVFENTDESHTITGDAINIPESYTVDDKTYKVVEIATDGFKNAVTSKTSINIPSSVKTICSYSFYNESDPTTITEIHFDLNNSGVSELTTIESSAFRNLTSLSKVYSGEDKGLNNLPEGLKYIKDYAFGNATELTSIVLPSTIKEVYVYFYDGGGYGWSASSFGDCSKLASISVAPSTDPEFKPVYSSKDGLLFKTSDTNDYYSLAYVPEGYAIVDNTFTIPTGTETVENWAISNLGDIQKIIVTSEIKTLNANSICYCTGLNTIHLESNNIANLTPEEINENKLVFIKNLNYITVDNGVTVESTSFLSEEFAKDTEVTECQSFNRVAFYVIGDIENGYWTATTLNLTANVKYKFIYDVEDNEYLKFNKMYITDTEYSIVKNLLTVDNTEIYKDGEKVEGFTIDEDGAIVLPEEAQAVNCRYILSFTLDNDVSDVYISGRGEY